MVIFAWPSVGAAPSAWRSPGYARIKAPREGAAEFDVLVVHMAVNPPG